MKKDNFPLRRIFVPSSKKYRNKFSVFLICSILSFFMWGLIKLSRVYEAPVKYQLSLLNAPSDKVLVKAVDTTITLYIKARGLELYSQLFNPDRNKITIDLSGMRLRREGNSFYGHLRTSRLLKDISEQLPLDNALLGAQPDTLRYIFEQEYRRRVPVTADLRLSFSDQFQLYDSIKLNPDSITLFGIKSILDTTYFVKTEHQVVRNLKESKLIALKIIKPKTKPVLTLSTDTVVAELKVERFTEAEIEVPVSNNSNDGIAFRTFPDKVKLTCRVAMREYERLDPSLFSVTINARDAAASQNNLAEIVITRQPSFARVIRIDPGKVEFLILK